MLLLVGGVLLAFELVPAPLTLYSAEVPPLYGHVAAAPDGVVLLELPYGIRDGVSSVGDFTARTQFYQTAHGKTIMGGYLSRLARHRVRELRADPVSHALAILSERKQLTRSQEMALLREAPGFIRRNNVGYVVIDRARSTASFQGLAIKGFRLRHVETNGDLSLYATDFAAETVALTN